MTVSGFPTDISKSSVFDQSRLAGLRPLAQLFSKEGLNKLGESIATFLKPRLSYNPDTWLNRVFNSLHDACASKNWVKPRQPAPEAMYARSFENVGRDKSFSDMTAYLRPKGIKDFTELARLVEISGINSNSRGIPGHRSQQMFGVKLFNSALRDGPARALFNELPPNLREALRGNGSIVDKNTGLIASVLYDASDPQDIKLRVVFAGTGNGKATAGAGISTEHVANDITTVGLLTSHVPPSYLQARELVGVLKGALEKTTNPKISLEVSGFSMGGGIASYAGIYNQVRTLSHCGTALSPACQRSLGQEKIRQAVEKNLIFNTSVSNDFVTDSKLINNMALGWEKISGLQVARHVGPCLQVSREGIEGHEQTKSGLTAHQQSFKLFSKMNEHLLLHEQQIRRDLDRVRN